MTFLTQLRNDVRSYVSWKSPLLYLLLLTPIIYTLLFGAIYSINVVNQLPLALYDADNSNISHQIASSYATSDKFQLTSEVLSYEALLEKVENGEVVTGIYIPPNFKKNIRLGHPVNIGVLINGSNLVYANGSLPAHQEILTSVQVKIAQSMAEALNQPPNVAMNTAYPVRISYRILSNPTNSYSNFMLLGLVVNGLQIALFLAAVPLLSKTYEDPLVLKGSHALTLIPSRFLICWVVSSFSLFVCLTLCYYIYAIPMVGPIWQVALLSISFTFVFTSLMLLFSACFTNVIAASQLPMVYIMPGLLYSGMSWPTEWMSPMANFFSKLMPLRYYGLPLRDLSLHGYAIDYTQNTLCMFFIGIIFLAITIPIYHWNQKRLLQKHIQEGTCHE